MILEQPSQGLIKILNSERCYNCKYSRGRVDEFNRISCDLIGWPVQRDGSCGRYRSAEWYRKEIDEPDES